MFQIHKKPQGDAAIKKSIQKLLDHKKDVVTRLKHLKNVIENATDNTELQTVFELYHSHIFYIFFENFLLIETNVKQKGAHRTQREELDSVLGIFEIRKEAIRLFVLWLQALQENACESTLVLYACLVPRFPTPKSEWNQNCSLNTILGITPDEAAGSFENSCLIPPPSGEIQPPDITKYFLDVVLECMVKQALVLQWKQRPDPYVKSFTFLWDLFKKYYLHHIFDGFRNDTSVYNPVLELPEPRIAYSYFMSLSENVTSEPCVELTAECALLPARVSVIKWIVVFISNAVKMEAKSRTSRHENLMDGLPKVLPRLENSSVSESMSSQPDIDSKPTSLNQQSNTAIHSSDTSHSNTSTLTEKEPSLSSLSSLDDKLRSKGGNFGEEDLVRKVLYSSRANINIIHEVARQAFLLPLTEAPTMRKVIKVYQEWIQDKDFPIFMEEPLLNESFNSDISDKDEPGISIVTKLSKESSASLRNTSYMRGQLNSMLEDLPVQAGCQTTYQLFVTNSANVFLVDTPEDADKLVQAQVDVCKRILNLYRHMVMHVVMDTVTWTQLLQVLLHVTRIMLQDEVVTTSTKTSVAGRLASPVFQTLIVSWIKANLFVHVSRELWDELVAVLSSLSQWKELIVEWAKNMETMTRVLARHVYGLELSDLPLDRLTEQKQKRKGKSSGLRETPSSEAYKPTPERSFSRGWSRDDVKRPSSPLTRGRSKSALTSGSSTTIQEKSADTKSPASGSSGSISSQNLTPGNEPPARLRSSTILGVESTQETSPLSNTTKSDTTSPASPESQYSAISNTVKRNDSLHRSSSASELNNTKSMMMKNTKPDSSPALRQRCNSGPDYQENYTSSKDVMSLSCVEDALNDKFDELIQQRLKNTGDDSVDNMPLGNDIMSLQSDTVSIDANWNPWAVDNFETDTIFSQDNKSNSDALTPSSDKELPGFSKAFENKDGKEASISPSDSLQHPPDDLGSSQSNLSSKRSSVSSLQYDSANCNPEYTTLPSSSANKIKRQASFDLSQSSGHKIDSKLKRIKRSTSLRLQRYRQFTPKSPLAASSTFTKSVPLFTKSSSSAARPTILNLKSSLNVSYNIPSIVKQDTTNAVTSNGDTASIEEPLQEAHDLSLPKPKRVSLLKRNSSSDGAQPYHLYKNTSRDRYDSTALLLPDLQFDFSNHSGMVSIGEEDGNERENEIMEQSSDYILDINQCDDENQFEDDSETDKSSHNNTLNQTDSRLTTLEERSILAGGRRTGWYPDVAVALWKRLLGVLGDVNLIKDPVIHKLVFTYLLKFLEVLFKMRDNLGITHDNQTTPTPPELIPPLRIMSPWAFKAVLTLPESHKSGKTEAYKLLCNTTLRKHDIRLEPDHLALFYLALHKGLHSTDKDEVNDIVRSCSPQFFSCSLPGSTLLLLDFIYACHTVATSADLEAPREEAQTILGSILCLPNLYKDLPVLKPSSPKPCLINCSNVKEYVADALLTSGKKEPSAPARCIALSSLGIWLFEELTAADVLICDQDETLSPGSKSSPTHLHFSSPTQGRTKSHHSRVKEAINVLLVSLKFSNRMVACVACSQLHLLTHCVDKLLEFIPEMPARIIEVISLSLSALLQNTDAKSTDGGRKLLVLLLLCLSDWCMAVPLHILTETTNIDHEKKLIRTVFKALQTGALGKAGHSAKHSYSLSDLASTDFDPHLPLDKVQDGNRTSQPHTPNSPNTPQSRMLSKLGLPPLPNVVLGQHNVVSLTASTVLSHLTNHLGHFPFGRGPSVLNSLVIEQHDHGTPDEIASYDLSPDLFTSPNVQFLIYNDTCLMSVVEIPSTTNTSDNICSSNSTVRLIVRDTGGKFCWDAGLLYSKNDGRGQSESVPVTPLEILNKEISETVMKQCKEYIDYIEDESILSCKVTKATMPKYEEGKNSNKLDQLLEYVGWSSPECQTQPGKPLNIPSLPPAVLGESTELLDQGTNMILKQHRLECENYSNKTNFQKFKCDMIEPKPITVPKSQFYYSRHLCSQSGFLARENRRRLSLLKKNERLIRELKNLDSRHCRETHKVAVVYIAPGQEDKFSILSNTSGSKEFENFVGQLGWEVDLRLHSGFRGKLQSDGSAGPSAPYYATSSLEVVYHVSTRFPSTDDDSRNVKLKHLGNDEVHIIWSEHSRDYRRGIIPTEFGDVLIIIYPMHHGLYRVQIQKKPDVPFFGPLFDGAIINKRILPILVRETAINAGRAKRSEIPLYQPYYEERAKYLRQIVEHYKEDSTYEKFITHLFRPAHGNRDISASSSSTSITSYKKPSLTNLSPSTTQQKIEATVETSISSSLPNQKLSFSSATLTNHPSPTPSAGSFEPSSNSNNNNNLIIGEDKLPVLPDSGTYLSTSTIAQHRRHSDFASHAIHKSTRDSIAKPRPKPPTNANKLLLPVPLTPKRQHSSESSATKLPLTPVLSTGFLTNSPVKRKTSVQMTYSKTVVSLPSPPSTPPSNKKIQRDFVANSSKLPYQNITE